MLITFGASIKKPSSYTSRKEKSKETGENELRR
jgi:hypothetical protein